MEPAETTLYLTLPLDLVEEFERCAREEGLTESQLFQRMFGFYQDALEVIRASADAQDAERLERLFLEGLASEPAMTMDTPEWEEFWKKVQDRTKHV
jgi:hypothetical protein